jgi:hypothetical protein
MANGHGGVRQGAGRKAKAEAYAGAITAAERRIADRLPRLLDNLEYLADGGYEEVAQTFEPAGLVFVEAPVRDRKGVILLDAMGRPLMARQRAFPDLPPEQLVCVRRVVTVAAPDRAANIYLVDRILGKPVAAVEVAAELNPGEAMLAAFGATVARIYGAAEDTGDGA